MLTVNNLTKRYAGNSYDIFRNLNFFVNDGEFVSFFGPNGCGKTTLLNIIAGLTKASSGNVLLSNNIFINQRVGFAFQDYKNSLYPWFNVKENLAFPLNLLGFTRDEINTKIKFLYKTFKVSIPLTAHIYELSGGQQQFVAFLRGIIVNPKIYLLDEPFSSLDYQTTLLFMERISRIWLKMRIPTIFISHDIDEAIFLSQRIFLLSNKPAKIVKIFDVPFTFPRKLSIMHSLRFSRIKNNILKYYTEKLLSSSSQSIVC